MLRHEIFTVEFRQKYLEIEQLLEEAYKHQKEFDNPCWKSSEGWITIGMPEYFWVKNNDRRLTISIYSYALGPSRSHEFNNIDKALEAVKKWHQAEMSYDYVDDLIDNINYFKNKD